MSHLRTWSCLTVAIAALLLPGVTWAQQSQYPPPPPAPSFQPSPGFQQPPAQPTPTEPQQAMPPPADSWTQPQPAPTTTIPASPDSQGTGAVSPAPPSDAPLTPPNPDSLRTRPNPPLTESGLSPQATPTLPPPPAASGVLLDGRPRQGPFLSGPGSLTFVLQHSLLGAMGGFFTQGFAQDFKIDRDSREAMLAGTLIGAGLGFGASAWWQFNHWVDRPLGYFSIANAAVGGMFLGGFMDLFTNDRYALSWSAFAGAELASWLTAVIGGGQLPLNQGLLISSGAAWGLVYSTLLLAIIHFSENQGIRGKTWADTLLIAPGIGAGALAIASTRYNPSSGQILRADIFGAGVGAFVLLVSGVALGGFNQPTPYVLSFLGSAGAIATVSLLWDESVDRTASPPGSGGYKSKRPYKGLW
ncbi:hypothetical protein [Hyalangium minutum]|uniref:Uncharacterized protein n=1 Tax=Hyalangium minutum TaxID=394096 RepID=A0A085WGP9_9BACT|nr:hypothetical protein [Hyalangium minutum]KFE66862.1 hypothetical protein DB31_9076 [Hyalangium minutum]